MRKWILLSTLALLCTIPFASASFESGDLQREESKIVSEDIMIETEANENKEKTNDDENKIDYEKESFNGSVAFLKQSYPGVIDIYIKPDIDYALQAFDFLLDTNGEPFEYVSHTGYNLQKNEDSFHLMSIGNGMEWSMKAGKTHKVASIIVPVKNTPYSVSLKQADLAIAHTPLPPTMDEIYHTFPAIIVNP